MRDPLFEHDLQIPMQTMLTVVRCNAQDGPGAVVRMIHHLTALAIFDAPESMLGALVSLRDSCLVALGGEEMPTVTRPEIPAYRRNLSMWDPEGLRVNLEAARRVGLRHGAFADPKLKQWLDYVLNVLEHDLRRVA